MKTRRLTTFDLGGIMAARTSLFESTHFENKTLEVQRNPWGQTEPHLSRPKAQDMFAMPFISVLVQNEEREFFHDSTKEIEGEAINTA